MPVVNLNNIYALPLEYNNVTKINLKLINDNNIAIEGNKKFVLLNKQKTNSDYFDTIAINLPIDGYDSNNKIYIKFDDAPAKDSIILVVSKSDKQNMYWKQIFYSSVFVNKLNAFSEDKEKFRINKDNLVSGDLLINNDSLIGTVINYFNSSKDTLKLGECGTNSTTFKAICDRHSLPCRIIGLMAGDAYSAGFNYELGYPIHALCEVYSSRTKKWYVIDPSYGFRYKKRGADDYLNAVEISNKFFFGRDEDIIQDSILFTKRTLVGRDYFKYFENIYYTSGLKKNFIANKVSKLFYRKFDYEYYQFTNIMQANKDANNYLMLKSAMYLFLVLLYFNGILFIFLKRLYKVKKPV